MIPDTRGAKVASWAAQLVVAAILLQTLWFKFTGAPESVWIFERLGAEPWGRYASGALELIAGLASLTSAFAALGALLAGGLMAGAVGSHLTVLGIEVQGDGGLLFGMAWAVLGSAALVLWLRRDEIPVVGRRRGGTR